MVPLVPNPKWQTISSNIYESSLIKREKITIFKKSKGEMTGKQGRRGKTSGWYLFHILLPTFTNFDLILEHKKNEE